MKIRPLSESTDPVVEDGWYERKGSQKVYSIQTRRFREWVNGLAEERAALRWLHDEQLLILKDGAKLDFPNIEWAVTWSKVTKKGHRCYRFLDPVAHNR